MNRQHPATATWAPVLVLWVALIGCRFAVPQAVYALPPDTPENNGPAQPGASPDVEQSPRLEENVRQARRERRRSQFARLVAGELEVVAVACETTDQQHEALVEYLEAWIDPALERFALALEQPPEARIEDGPEHQPTAPPDREPGEMVARAVHQACETLLSEQQADQYERELQLRQASRRLAAIQNMIVSLDSYLTLTAEQHNRLETRLRDAWPASFEATLPEFVHAGEFAAAIPTRLVEQELSPQQRLVYRRLADHWPDAGWDDIAPNSEDRASAPEVP